MAVRTVGNMGHREAGNDRPYLQQADGRVFPRFTSQHESGVKIPHARLAEPPVSAPLQDQPVVPRARRHGGQAQPQHLAHGVFRQHTEQGLIQIIHNFHQDGAFAFVQVRRK
jgi:hypothetical protein